METRPAGATALSVTPIGLGMAAIGRPGYINLGHDADLGPERSVDTLRRRAHALLDAAYDAGIRYIDAARSYGLAEDFLASWFDARGLADDAVTVGSKWGYTYTGQWRVDAEVHEVKDHSLGALQRQLRESHALLGNRLDLYQIHSATLDTGVLEDRSVLAELSALAAGGLRIGLTVSGPGQADTIRRALEAGVDGGNPFVSVQASWNLLEPSAGEALAEAHAAGWVVIVKEALANGRLTARNPELAARPDLAEHAGGASLDALAIAAALAQPWSDVVLSGAATPEQLHSNLVALDLHPDLEPLGSLAEEPESYWSRRSELPWV